MAAYTIPSIYTAIDRVSGPVKAMGRNIHSFATKTQKAIGGIIPSLSQVAKEFLAFAGITSLFALGLFSINTLKDYEKAVASFRVIVGGSDSEFAAYKKSMNEVANATGKSTIEVASAYENIAGLNEKLAETPDSIAAVTKAAITMSQASGDDLGASAANLVSIMNQFSLEANDADRAINVLAAGQAVGAASIGQTADAYKNFGSVAAGANITLEESTALVQTLGKFSVFGSEAGTKLRGSILKLQQAGVGYASGQFNINDALEEARKKIDRLKTAKQKDLALQKMFGAENISTGRILLDNIGIYKEFVAGVSDTNAAQEAAAINTNTLSDALDRLKARFVNILTASDNSDRSLNIMKSTVIFLTDNLSTIITVAGLFIGALIGLKIILIAVTTYTTLYNVAMGVMGVITGKASIAIGSNAVALGAYKTVLAIATAAQWVFNAAMAANPIGLIIAAIIALIALVVVSIRNWETWGAALSVLLGPVGLLISYLQTLRKNWDDITTAFKTGGIKAGIIAIGKTIVESILFPIQQLLTLVAKFDPTGLAEKAAIGIQTFMDDHLKINNDQVPEPLNPALDKQESLSRSITENNQNLKITIDERTGRTSFGPVPDNVEVNTSSTLLFR